jgi:uncharacterized protein YcnI
MTMVSKHRITVASACGALAATATTAALAHVTLEQREAALGSTYKATFRVPHGCAGSPMTTLRVRIPEGFVNVKPMPKPGWTLEIVKGPYKTPIRLEHGELKEGAVEIVWRGGKLLDEHYDEFVMRGTLVKDLKPGTMLYFPAVQECEKGVERWIDIPADGKSADDYPSPAPGLKLVPAK